MGTPCALAIAFGASVRVLHGDTWKLQVEKLITLGCLGALDGLWCSELNHCGVKLQASVRVSN